MTSKILVVDGNVAFAAMLEQMLSDDGGYQVQRAHTAAGALAILQTSDFDLTILDMDLGSEAEDYRDLIRSVREVRPRMRLMLIPIMGEELPPESSGWDLQGTLTKPFFADDLLPNIENALTRDVMIPEPEVVVQPDTVVPEEFQPIAAEPIFAVDEAIPELRSILSDLARETSADMVFLLFSDVKGSGVIEHVSSLSAGDLDSFAGMLVNLVQAAQRTARFLGEPDESFEHHMFESRDLRLYVVVLSQDLYLVVVTPITTPLGTVRHRLRRAARDLNELAFT